MLAMKKKKYIKKNLAIYDRFCEDDTTIINKHITLRQINSKYLLYIKNVVPNKERIFITSCLDDLLSYFINEMDHKIDGKSESFFLKLDMVS